jgi:hypothetical protein
MEDYVAESSIPVTKVVADVKRCDLYVVIVAWRYGYVPTQDRVGVEVRGAAKGQTSITEYEYLAAVETNKHRLAFLLHERAPWPPHRMDGFGMAGAGRGDLTKILNFRERLQKDQMVAFFEEPSDLEARLSAAVASVGLRGHMIENTAELQRGMEAFANAYPIDDSGRMPIENLVTCKPAPEGAVIDLATTWWSTRLYLLALAADLLTDVKRIVIQDADAFIGMVSTTHVRTMLRLIHPEIEAFERNAVNTLALSRSTADAVRQIFDKWRESIQEQPHQTIREQQIQLTVSRVGLIKWFGDGMLTGAVRVANPDQTTVLDTLRVLDYPNDYVPVIREKVTTDVTDIVESVQPPAPSQPVPPPKATPEPSPTLRVINKATQRAACQKTT